MSGPWSMVIARWPLPSSAPESWPSLSRLGIEARIGAQAIRRLEIHDQERHRAVGLGLQDEAAVEFQRRAEQRRQHDGLAEQLADRRPDNRAWSGRRRARGRAGSAGRADRAQRPRTAAPRRRPAPPTARGSGFPVRFSCRGIVRSWRFIWGRRAGIERAEMAKLLHRVVPANAGTHIHRRSIDCGRHLPPREDRADLAAWVPAFAGDDESCLRRPHATVSKHHARMPFCTCRRFSASSNTTDCGPSITSSVTSSPRWAGRQCMNSASGFASDISLALT